MRGGAALAALIAAWFGASVVAIASAKSILVAAPCPATLCAIQLGVAAVGLRQLTPTSTPSREREWWHVFGIAASYACGFLLTNAAIALAAPSFVETFKAAEPLSTVGLAMLVLGEREHAATYASLAPIVIGVAMASDSEVTFSLAGMVLALASNVSFSGRAVLTKALKRQFPSAPTSGSDMQLFYHVSRLGFWLLLPFAVLLDAHVLVRALLSSGDGGGGSDMDGASSNATLEDGGTSSSNADGAAPSAARLLAWIVINGTAHAAYNGVSFAVLGRVSVATHAVLNIVRRIVMIATAAVIFGTPITLFQWAGVALAGAGVGAFARSKNGPQPRLLPEYMDAGKMRAV